MSTLKEKVSHELRFIDEPGLANWILGHSYKLPEYVERAHAYLEDRYTELLISQPDLPSVVSLYHYMEANRAVVIRNLIFADEYPDLAHPRYREY